MSHEDISNFPTETGNHRRPCPRCDKGRPNDDTLSITVNEDGSAVWFCHRCEWKSGTRSRQATASEPGRWEWGNALPCTSHPYLTRKGVKGYGVREVNGLLLVPVRDIHGNWKGLQRIKADGAKRFTKGTQKKGGFHLIGEGFGTQFDLIYIAEGYATAATVHEAIGKPCAVAFDATNLLPVAQALRSKYPTVPLVIAGDDDRTDPKNPGRTKATAAARAAGAEVVFPELGDLKGSDFNDLMVARDMDAVRNSLGKAAPPESTKQERAEAIAAAVSRGQIVVEPGTMNRMVQQGIDALVSAGIDIFRRGESLVRVMRLDEDDDDSGIHRHKGSITLRTLSEARGYSWLLLQMDKSAEWVRWNERASGLLPTDAPISVAKTIAEVPDAYRWPTLHAIAQHPVLIDQGRKWIGAPGYHRLPGRNLYLDIRGEWLEPGTTREEAEQSLKNLKHHLRHYAFVDDVSRSVALSMLLTAVHRPMMDSAPMHAIDAPVRGSGKSKLVDVAAILATGTGAPVMDYGSKPEEAEKRLDGMQLAGDALISIDNIERPLEGASLNQAITQTTRRVRPLGGSQMVTVPCTAMFTATGNNLHIRGDMQRRVMVCRLDPQTERPELREFDQDLIAETLEKRVELVRTCQTIIRAYALSGDKGSPPLGSFEQWSRSIRDALIWLGEADPVGSQEKVTEDDPDRQAAISFCSVWCSTFGSAAQTCHKVISKAEGDPTLTNALSMICGKPDARALAGWLRRHKDQRIDTYQIRQWSAGGGIAQWRIQSESASKGGLGGLGGSVTTLVGHFATANSSIHASAKLDMWGESDPPNPPNPPENCIRCAGEGCDYCKEAV